jgi:hypothetical protein
MALVLNTKNDARIGSFILLANMPPWLADDSSCSLGVCRKIESYLLAWVPSVDEIKGGWRALKAGEKKIERGSVRNADDYWRSSQPTDHGGGSNVGTCLSTSRNP